MSWWPGNVPSRRSITIPKVQISLWNKPQLGTKMRCYKSSTSGEKELDYGDWVQSMRFVFEKFQGEATREEQPDWHLRSWPYGQPRRIPKQLIGLAIINLGFVNLMFRSTAVFSVQWRKFQEGGKCHNLVQIMWWNFQDFVIIWHCAVLIFDSFHNWHFLFLLISFRDW